MKTFTAQPLIAKHRKAWADRRIVLSAMIGLFFFVGSLFINYEAMTYSAKRAGSATTDILLQNLPVVNTDIIFSEGALVFVIFILLLLVAEPFIVPFTIKTIALFICVRSLFVIMTHLGPSPDHITTDFDSLGYISSGSDLFFSGHTGLPFLMALLFWSNKKLRWIFLFSSIFAGAAVLLGHLHYTIDVFSAFFITYGIYHIAIYALPRDYQLFSKNINKTS